MAGLTDPDYSGEDNQTGKEHKQASIDLAVLLCYVFGDKRRGGPLNRITLWDRIESALRTSTAKVDDGNTDLFLSLCLEHVHAIDYRGHILYLGLLPLSDKPLSWRQGWVRYIARHVPAIIGHGSMAWEREKQKNADARALEFGGVLSTGEVVVKEVDGE